MKYLSVGPLSDTVNSISHGEPAAMPAGLVSHKSKFEDWKTEGTNKQAM